MEHSRKQVNKKNGGPKSAEPGYLIGVFTLRNFLDVNVHKNTGSMDIAHDKDPLRTGYKNEVIPKSRSTDRDSIHVR